MQRPQWMTPILTVLRLLATLGGVAGYTFSGICGFEADAGTAAACLLRWRLGSGMLTVAGIIRAYPRCVADPAWTVRWP